MTSYQRGTSFSQKRTRANVCPIHGLAHSAAKIKTGKGLRHVRGLESSKDNPITGFPTMDDALNSHLEYNRGNRYCNTTGNIVTAEPRSKKPRGERWPCSRTRRSNASVPGAAVEHRTSRDSVRHPSATAVQAMAHGEVVTLITSIRNTNTGKKQMERKLSPLPYEAGECSSSGSRRPGLDCTIPLVQALHNKKQLGYWYSVKTYY